MEYLANLANDSSIEIIEHLENNEYDQLLTKNIVFIQLHEASAVNTLIECVVRNTPIVINKLPAIVEVLGSDYPLFYNNLDEATNIINYKNIMSTIQIEEFDKTFIQSKKWNNSNYFLNKTYKYLEKFYLI